MNPLLEKLCAMTRPHHAQQTELAKIRKLLMSALENLIAAEANVVAMAARYKSDMAALQAKLDAVTAPTDAVPAADVQKAADGINAAIAS